MIDWHLEPRSKRLIAKLKGRVEQVRQIAVPCDYFIFVGVDRAAQRTLKALEARRTRAVERVAGGAFTELNAAGRGLAYLNTEDQAPSVYEVLA